MLDELRRAWVSGRRVAVSVTSGRRFEGWIARVAATGAFVVVDVPHPREGVEIGPVEHELIDVPAELLLGVHNPSTLGDSTHRWELESPWKGKGYAPPPPQVEALFERDAYLGGAA